MMLCDMLASRDGQGPLTVIYCSELNERTPGSRFLEAVVLSHRLILALRILRCQQDKRTGDLSFASFSPTDHR